MITKKEYGEIRWPKYPDMQKYTEKRTFEVVPLTDGYIGIDKSRIETQFCFSYGMNGCTTSEEVQEAVKEAEDAKSWAFFHNENMKDKNEKLENLKKAIESGGKFFESTNYKRLSIIAIRKNPCDWEILDSRYCKNQMITLDEIVKGASERNRCEYRVATIEELSAIYAAEKREAEAFEKRLATWWKKYGAAKMRTWAFLSD